MLDFKASYPTGCPVPDLWEPTPDPETVLINFQYFFLQMGGLGVPFTGILRVYLPIRNNSIVNNGCECMSRCPYPRLVVYYRKGEFKFARIFAGTYASTLYQTQIEIPKTAPLPVHIIPSEGIGCEVDTPCHVSEYWNTCKYQDNVQLLHENSISANNNLAEYFMPKFAPCEESCQQQIRDIRQLVTTRCENDRIRELLDFIEQLLTPKPKPKPKDCPEISKYKALFKQ